MCTSTSRSSSCCLQKKGVPCLSNIMMIPEPIYISVPSALLNTSGDLTYCKLNQKIKSFIHPSSNKTPVKLKLNKKATEWMFPFERNIATRVIASERPWKASILVQMCMSRQALGVSHGSCISAVTLLIEAISWGKGTLIGGSLTTTRVAPVCQTFSWTHYAYISRIYTCAMATGTATWITHNLRGYSFKYNQRHRCPVISMPARQATSFSFSFGSSFNFPKL